MWLSLVFFKDANSMETATAITILLAPYLAVESIRKSSDNKSSEV